MSSLASRSILLIAIAISSTACGAGGSPEAGKQKATTCAACHGADGNSVAPDFPRIAGQYEDYLYHSLVGYQTGQRKDPIMAEQVKNLSRQDMQDLAAYFASQEGLYLKR